MRGCSVSTRVWKRLRIYEDPRFRHFGAEVPRLHQGDEALGLRDGVGVGLGIWGCTGPRLQVLWTVLHAHLYLPWCRYLAAHGEREGRVQHVGTRAVGNKRLNLVRQGAGERPAFAQQLSGRVHVGTWAGGHNCLNLRISQEKEIMAWCAVSGSSPRTPFVTPVLPGPGSGKVLDKTRKSGVWFFRDAGGWLST